MDIQVFGQIFEKLRVYEPTVIWLKGQNYELRYAKSVLVEIKLKVYL